MNEWQRLEVEQNLDLSTAAVTLAAARVNKITCGFKFQLGGFWVGWHWSKYNRRICINVLPCLTFWVALKGGKTP